MAEFIETTLMDGFADGPHVTEVQIGLANQAVIGPDDYVLEGGRESEAQILTNNSIRIFDGVYCIQGRRDVIPANGYTDVTIANGSQSMNRNDIIVRRYRKDESSEIETTEYAVIKGTPSSGTAVDPKVTIGDIRSGATLHEMALYRVKLTGLNITAVEPMFNILKNMATLQKEFTELNSKMIPVFVSNPFQFAGTGNKTFKYTVSGNGYAFISLSGHIGCEAGNDYGQLEVKIWDKNHILLTMDRCVEATTFNYDFGAACSTVIPVQDGDVITGTLLASKNGKKTILANACCFGCQISITHD